MAHLNNGIYTQGKVLTSYFHLVNYYTENARLLLFFN